MGNFRVDLKKGQDTQNKVFEHLKENGWKEIDGDRMKYYDGEFQYENNRTVRFEIKSELKYADSPSCYVEYSCGGKLSGIRSSRSDVCIHIMQDDCFIYSTRKMLDLWYYLDGHLGKDYRQTTEEVSWKIGGDGPSKAMLVHRANLVQKLTKENKSWARVCKFDEISSVVVEMMNKGVL